jgi:hypothetical protein
MYKIYTSQYGQTVVRTSDNSWIPMDEDNTDYQAYLAWVAEGNTAEEWSAE